MRYIGSKLRLIDFIQDTVKKHCGDDLHEKVFCDIFAGTGVVGRSFSPIVKKVIANDLEKYAYIANYVALKGFNEENVKQYLAELNEVQLTKDSSLYNAYACGGSAGRLYFSEYNGEKIAAAREWLSENQDRMSFDDYMAVLFSIIDGADKVANTMSTYGAYAKKIKSNSIKGVEFVLPKKTENASSNNEVYLSDANELIKEVKGGILYLDPPYNNRQYGSNYHVLNSIAIGEAPDTDSVTGVEKDSYNKSDYCREKTVGEALDNLIKNADFEWIFLSYNNEGLLSFDEIKSIMSKYGDYSVEGTEYQRYKADNSRKQAANGVVEYIHVLHKGVFTERADVPEDDPYGHIVESMQTVEEPVEPKIKFKKIVFGEKDRQRYEDLIESATPEEVKIKSKDKTVSLNKRPSDYGSQEALAEAIEDEIKKSFPAEDPHDLVIERPIPALDIPVTTLHIKADSIIDSIETKFSVTTDGVTFDDDEKYVVSPMNYMGGKKKLIGTLKKYFPKDVKVFVDLFCGGATVGINADAEWVMFNDNITPLIEMYKYMQQHSVEKCLSYIDETIEKWGLVQGEEGEEAYYRFRDEHYNATPVKERHPLDLFILMAFSFNNQIRFAVNKNWKFNIPFGKDRSSFNGKMRENLIGFINALHNRNCFFMSVDFRDVPLDKGAFVYADPPYLISQATYNDGWDEKSEVALLNMLNKLDLAGGKFALSNVLENKGKTNTILKEWAEINGYKIIHLNKSYANSYYHRKERESKTDEVLIVNY